MKFTLVILLCFLRLNAQSTSTVYCKTSLLNTVNMKGLYGGKSEVFQARTSCKNIGMNPAAIDGVTIDLSLPTINSMPSSQSSALLTKTFKNQRGERITRDLTTGVGALGILQAGRYAFLSSGPFGVVVAAFVAVTQYIMPLFTSTEPPLDFSNQCDQVSTGIILAPGGSISCTTYIQKPPKGAPPLQGAFDFYLLGSNVNPPVVMPPQPPEPVKAKPPVLHGLFHRHKQIEPSESEPCQEWAAMSDVYTYELNQILREAMHSKRS